jgi:hypothetical protein
VVVSAPLVADGDELSRAERELMTVRQARDESLARSRSLQAAGNDASAAHAGRLSRDHAQAARALAGEVVLLREGTRRLEDADARLVRDLVQRFFETVDIPWSPPTRALLGGLLRQGNADAPDLRPLAEGAARELRRHFARVLGDVDVAIDREKGVLS